MRPLTGKRFTAILFAFSLLTASPHQASAQQVEIKIRGPGPADDYLTWAPAPGRIRQIPDAQGIDRPVVLSNDPEAATPPGRQHPLDGNVAFAKSMLPGQTATADALALVLPKDGSWVDFVIAGSFPRASSEDKDAIIEVHDGNAGGPVLGRYAVMVRIRKNQGTLTDRERTRFLRALAILHSQPNGYERFLKIHEQTSMGHHSEMSPPYFWPDIAHRGPAFLAWHRAYLLQFERELQRIDPSVTLPYWRMDTLPSVFEQNFLGANSVVSATFVEPTFAADNPIANWQNRGVPLYRFPYERRDQADLTSKFRDDAKVFADPTYRGFARKIEGNPHNDGHNWTGPWMQNCMISPSDPVFWPFHSGFDRQWAKWQWLGGHIQPDGSQESYFPTDTFDPAAPGCAVADPNGCVAIGHHLKDTMWPWDGKVGHSPTEKASRPPANSSIGLLGPIPKASMAGLWPAAPMVPTPGDMIDYAGLNQGRLDMGFAYDDVPYGVQQTLVASSAPAPVTVRPESIPGANSPIVEAQLSSGQVDTGDGGGVHSQSAAMVATDTSRAAAERIKALRSVAERNDGSVTAPALQILRESGGDTALRVAAINSLAVEMTFANIDEETHHRIMAALRQALGDNDIEVRRSALRVLISNQDPVAVEQLSATLQNPSTSKFTTLDAIQGIQIAGVMQEHAASLRGFLSSPDPTVRAAAVTALASDQSSRSEIQHLMSDSAQPYEVRSAALRSLASTDPEGTTVLLGVIQRSGEDPALRLQAATALTITVQSRGAEFSQGELNSLAEKLRAAEKDTTVAPALDRALKATESFRSNE